MPIQIRNAELVDLQVADFVQNQGELHMAPVFVSSDWNLTKPTVHLATGGGAGITGTLPRASMNRGKTYYIKKIDDGAGQVLIQPQGADTIDGMPNVPFIDQYASLGIVSDGVNTWHIISCCGGDGDNPGWPYPSHDWWDPYGAGLCVWCAYQPKGAANQAASYTDLTGNGRNAGVGVAPGWAAGTGWQFNGVNQYLTTPYNIPQVDQSQSVIIRYSSLVGAGHLTGLYCFITRAFDIGNVAVGGNRQFANGQYLTVIAATPASGTLAIAGNKGYSNGVADPGVIGAWNPAGCGWAMWIGCYNANGVPTSHANFHCQAYAIYDCTLTPTEVAQVHNAMMAI